MIQKLSGARALAPAERIRDADIEFATHPDFGDSFRIRRRTLARYQFGLEILADHLPALKVHVPRLCPPGVPLAEKVFREPVVRMLMEDAFDRLEAGTLAPPDDLETFLSSLLSSVEAGRRHAKTVGPDDAIWIWPKGPSSDFLKAGQVSVDLFALVRSEEDGEDAGGGSLSAGGSQTLQLASTFAVGEEAEMAISSRVGPRTAAEEIVAPLDRASPALVPGESVRIDAVVRTRGVGHFFPGGTVDAFDVWLELIARDASGQPIFWSGYAEDAGSGPVEPGAHFYRSLMLDGKGQPINKRNAWAARSALYVQLIAPGSANTVRFRMRIPEDVEGPIELEARVNYRKFAWWNTQFAYAGVRDASVEPTPDYDLAEWSFDGDLSEVSGPMKEIPDVPIVTMATDRVTLPVGEASTAPVYNAEDALRWNDYGIGLLLQGDLRAAEKAFRTVTELDPDYADGFVNVARVLVVEGEPEGAQTMLDEALSRSPDLAKAHYFYGLTLKTQGRYDEALESFERAAEAFPRDRVVRNQIGRLHFLKREYPEAIAELEKSLRVDPEDLEAHYNLMLAHQGNGDPEKAAAHQKLYLRFKADEASQFLTGDYRRENPFDNNERLPIHEHGNALGREDGAP